MEGKGDDDDVDAATAAALAARFEAAATEATAVAALAQIEAHAVKMGANHFIGGPMAREAVNKIAKEKKGKMGGEWTSAVAKALGGVLGALAFMCDQCDKLPAAHFCRDCDEYLCVACNERHGEHRKKKLVGATLSVRLRTCAQPTFPRRPRPSARITRP